MWVKCAMVATVAFARLDLFRTGRDEHGKRKFLQPKLFVHDFDRVRAGIRSGPGIW